MSEKSTGTIVYAANPDSESTLTAEQSERLHGLRDEEIDFSDAAPTPYGSAWYRPGTFSPSNSVRLDKDVLAFFRRERTPDSARVNDVLRSYIQAQKRAS